MLRLFIASALLLSAADHWTTYLCLSSEVPGWQVTEANPLPAFLFEHAGLRLGLLIDSVITIAALVFLLRTQRIQEPFKLVFLALLILATALAVANNLGALSELGVSPVLGA